MYEQMTIFDLPGNITFAPKMWECMKTCRNCGIYMDKFPGTDKPRCLYGVHMDGTSGKYMILKTDESGLCSFWCKYYKPKEKYT